jgi:spore germination protein YaaH
MVPSAQIPESATEQIAQVVAPPFMPLESAAFKEIWGYVQAGDEASLNTGWPVSDVVLFGAGIGSTGKLRGVPNRSALKKYSGRVHLVIAELSNYALLHFCMSPEFPIRAKLIDQIAEAAKHFDGVNIDFESVLTEDTENFISFLREIKKRIGKKTLSVALPARTKKTTEAYDYTRVAAVADRVIIMAYDEHWSGSKPGSVASLSWCSKVAQFALQTIGGVKLVMGIPFYGRAWGEINPSRAYRYPTVAKLIEEKGITAIGLADGSNYFEYVETIKVRVYFEDHRSVHRRATLYGGMGVGRIAFWRVGQEDSEIWKHLLVVGK